MCFGKPKIDTSYQDFQMEEAERARAEEAARQRRINQGLEHIRAVFEGGSYGDNTYAGMQPILDQRRQAQEEFYFPQLDQSRDRAQDDLTFALARAGLLNSTTAGERQARLAQDYALQRGSILSNIAADIAGTRSNINQQRSAIESGLRASGDASQAADQALASAVTFREDMPSLNPLGHLFYGVSEGIGAARAGQEVERIKRLARTSPLNTSSGRLVGA